MVFKIGNVNINISLLLKVKGQTENLREKEVA